MPSSACRYGEERQYKTDMFQHTFPIGYLIHNLEHLADRIGSVASRSVDSLLNRTRVACHIQR